MVCQCGHQDHDWETGICKFPGNCFCTEYKELKSNQSVIPQHRRYLEQYSKIEEKVKYILDNIPETRDMKNKDFVFLYWDLVHGLNIINNETIRKLTDPESIRRCRQALVEHEPEKYGPTKEEFVYEKHLKENATYQYVMEKYL